MNGTMEAESSGSSLSSVAAELNCRSVVSMPFMQSLPGRTSGPRAADSISSSRARRAHASKSTPSRSSAASRLARYTCIASALLMAACSAGSSSTPPASSGRITPPRSSHCTYAVCARSRPFPTTESCSTTRAGEATAHAGCRDSSRSVLQTPVSAARCASARESGCTEGRPDSGDALLEACTSQAGTASDASSVHWLRIGARLAASDAECCSHRASNRRRTCGKALSSQMLLAMHEQARDASA
mmetsp:Transcript_4723/g.20189  ORF Transcript_4723/g.20189 Transcript_4723/m.20189 type:complete len:244 (+) Transcript_4723:1958-2689(+)